MATAKITLVDDGEDVRVTLDFGDGGAKNESSAHLMAVQMVKFAHGGLEDEEDDE